jgi:hypothetical protein
MLAEISDLSATEESSVKVTESEKKQDGQCNTQAEE